MAILDNPMFECEEKNSVTTDESVAGDAESQGMVTEMAKDPVKSFGMEFAKKWPFGTFKTINTLLLLALLLCTALNQIYSLSWSNFHNVIPIGIINNDGAWTSTDIMIQHFVGLFIVSFLSMAAYWILRRKLDSNKHSLGCIGIWDIVFSSIAIPICINAFAIYGLMAAAEWKWFFPKLTNSSMTLAELTESKINQDPDDPYSRYHWEYEYPAPEFRKKIILVRLAADSSILILLAILIPMNLFSFSRIRKMIKRTNLWLNLSEYSQFYAESNENDKKYAQFWPNGLFKFLFWFIPILYCIFEDARGSVTILHVFTFAMAMFFHWLYFIRKTRFRSMDDLKASKLAENNAKFRFSFMVLFDIFVAFDAILFYIFFIQFRFNSVKYAFLLHLIHLIYITIFFWSRIIQRMPQNSLQFAANFNQCEYQCDQRE